MDRHKAFLARVLPEAKEELEQVISSLPYGLGPHYRRRLMKEAQEIAKGYVIPWLRPDQEEAEQQYRRVSPRFVEMGNDFLKKIAKEGIPGFARMPHALDPEVAGLGCGVGRLAHRRSWQGRQRVGDPGLR